MCILQVIHHCLKNSHHNIIKFSVIKIDMCDIYVATTIHIKDVSDN